MGNLLGATLDDAARTASNVGMIASTSIGIVNGYISGISLVNNSLVLFIARDRWGYLFNHDPEVVKLVAEVMPYCAIFQVPNNPKEEC